ncbi:hypothetical protein MP228_008849 [Amoeboaphelidium protococcarum]|nr:hypothetical protein MP228_008849 [Amoeboaphelidium protococcarum]
MPNNKRKKKAESPGVAHQSNGNGFHALESQIFRNYFYFTDMTPQATILWASPSSLDLVGRTPEEMVGKSCYAFLHPDELEAVRRNHVFSFAESVIARILTVRFLCKERDGTQVFKKMDFLINDCYDCFVIVSANHEFSKDSISFRQSAEDRVKIGPTGALEAENWLTRKHVTMQMLSDTLTWEQSSQTLKEPRVCLVLNRYTIKATIQFATAGAWEVLNCTDRELIGKSLYDFIKQSEEDQIHDVDVLERLKGQINFVKSSGSVHHFSFTWKSTHLPIECEGIITSTWDGLICVVRRKQ